MAGYKPYFRPNQKWVCGYAKHGKPCPKGPSSKGDCQTSSFCEPRFDGNGYQCTRAPQFGGKCTNGPNSNGSCSQQIVPCQPDRSIRSQRGMFVLLALAITAGLLLLALSSSDQSSNFLSPGHLSNQHASIKHNCSSCHAVKEGSGVNWLLSKTHPNVKDKSCMSCHDLGKHAMFAHSISKDALKIRSAAEIRELDSLSCTSCHKEHRGLDANIKHMNNQSCQACHQERFHSFKDGHPEFENYPFNRRSRILFDHNTHFGQHFPEAEKEVSCQSCHRVEKLGQAMVLKPFEQTCKECHNNQIRGIDQLKKSVVFFRLPGVDIASLKEAGLSIGTWQEYAEGQITGFMHMALLQDEEAKELLASLPGLDWSDLSEYSKKQKLAVAKLIWKIKEQLVSLLGEGAGAFISQVSEDLKIDQNKLLAGLPIDVVRTAIKDWLPGLQAELEKRNNGSVIPTKVLSEAPDNMSDIEWMQNGGWYRDNGYFSLLYRPKSHMDQFFQTWIDSSAQMHEANPGAKTIFNQMANRSESAGQCMKCHSVDKVGEQLHINWKGKNRQQLDMQFTKFSHKKHFSLLNEKGCFTCHQLNSDGRYELAYEGFDPKNFSSNFAPVKKETCLQCHTDDNVGSTCLNCHNYHVNRKDIEANVYDKIVTSIDSKKEDAAEPKNEAEVNDN